MKVDAAAELFAIQGDDFPGGSACGVGGVDADDDLSVHIDHHGYRGSEHLGVEVACGVEDGVAEGFGIDAAEVLTGEESVLWIGGVCFCGVGGGLPIGGGVEDDALEVFETPVVPGQFGGEPVEEFGV